MSGVVIVGVDGSETGTRAAHFAAEHFGRSGGAVVVAYVVPWSPYTISTMEENERRAVTKQQETDAAQNNVVEPLVAELQKSGAKAEGVVRHGHPAETLCEIVAERGGHHIVVGRRGQSKVKTLLFGSTPVNLIQLATVPVTVVP